MARKVTEDLKVGDECYFISPYLKSKRLKVTEVLQVLDGTKYKIKFHDGSFCTMYGGISVMHWNENAQLFLDKELALYELEHYARIINNSIKEIKNELI